jgi:tRNA(Ile2)-agmatinylcytidine synthase
LIAYRKPENCGTRRRVEPRSVRDMEAKTFPHTFNSYDHESGRVLIAPTGPDPVLAGVRGDSPRAVLEAFRRVRIDEDILGHVIYVTNQCTDAHLQGPLSTPLRAYSAGWLEGVVVSMRPYRGGHLMIQLRVGGSFSTVSCMVYEPSGDLRRVARHLRPGNSVRVWGGVRRGSSKNPVVVNVERIDVLAVDGESKANPRCTACGSGMKSEGRGKGFQCRKCGHRSVGPSGVGAPESVARIHPGSYLPSPRAQRHLTKQLVRYGREQTGVRALVEGWMEPQSPEPFSVPSRLLSLRPTSP